MFPRPRPLLCAARASPVYRLTANDQGAREATGFAGFATLTATASQQIAENSTKQFRQIETAMADNVETEKPATISGAGFLRYR
jgi:hypothetical protein